MNVPLRSVLIVSGLLAGRLLAHLAEQGGNVHVARRGCGHGLGLLRIDGEVAITLDEVEDLAHR